MEIVGHVEIPTPLNGGIMNFYTHLTGGIMKFLGQILPNLVVAPAVVNASSLTGYRFPVRFLQPTRQCCYRLQMKKYIYSIITAYWKSITLPCNNYMIFHCHIHNCDMHKPTLHSPSPYTNPAYTVNIAG